MKKILWIGFVILTILRTNAQTCDTYVGGYIPSWRDPADVDYTKLSHAFYAFGSTNTAGEVILDNENVFSSFKTATTGKQRFLSIGGAGNTSLSAMTISASAINTFTNNCATFCQSNDLQGIDVDWEGIITVQDSVKFGALMRALASALHPHGLQLIATIAYGSYGGDFYNIGALKAADWIQLMVYDQTGTWAESPYGNHSTFQHMLDAISYWTTRGYTDLSRIVIGLPFYGYRFSSYQGGLATALSYSEIVSAQPNLSCDQDDVSMTFFNSPQTIRDKTIYTKTHGLKGVMIWEMSQDIPSTQKKSLLNAISLAACDLPAACDTFFVTGLSSEPVRDEIILAPNPVDHILQISLQQSRNRISKLELMDNLGRILFSKDDSFSEAVEKINVSKLSPGMYHLKITLADNRIAIKRVVKL